MAAEDTGQNFHELELNVMHTYVHRFVQMRFNVFAGTFVLLGIVLPLATQGESDILQYGTCCALMLVIILSILMLRGLSKAIWVVCAYCVLIEKKLKQRGGQHYWVAVNSYSSGYSTNHAIYVGVYCLTTILFLLTFAYIAWTASVEEAPRTSWIMEWLPWIEANERRTRVQVLLENRTGVIALYLLSGLYLLTMLLNLIMLKPSRILRGAVKTVKNIDDFVTLPSQRSQDTVAYNKIPKEVREFLGQAQSPLSAGSQAGTQTRNHGGKRN